MVIFSRRRGRLVSLTEEPVSVRDRATPGSASERVVLLIEKNAESPFANAVAGSFAAPSRQFVADKSQSPELSQ